MGLDIRYARSGGVSIAYQAVGNGDVDLLYVPDYVSNLVYVLFGSHDGCSMAVLYAASYPERKRALVLFHSVAHDPEGDSEAARQDLARLRDSWGTQEYSDELLEQTEPSVAVDPDERQWFANWLRVGASPSVAYALNRAWFQTDLREILPSVRVPTLVLHRASFAEANALDVAGRIRGARAVRVSGTDYGSVYLSPEIPDEIEGFVAGEEAPAVPETSSPPCSDWRCAPASTPASASFTRARSPAFRSSSTRVSRLWQRVAKSSSRRRSRTSSPAQDSRSRTAAPRS